MNKPLYAAAAACVLLPSLASAKAADMRYFARRGLPAESSSASATPPATPRTLVCSGFSMGRNAVDTGSPMDVQGPIDVRTTPESSFATCNEIGRLHGEAFRGYNHCRVVRVDANAYYSYLVKAASVIDVSSDPALRNVYGDANCSYNP